MLWQLFLIFFLIWLLIVRWKNRDKRQLSNMLKSDIPTLPFLGISHQFIGSDEDRMNAINNVGRESIKQGGLTHIWLAHRFFCICTDPVDAEYVLKNCLEKDDILKFVRALTGNGSIFAPVSIWRPRRKVLAPTFGLRNLNQFVSIFSDQSSIMVDRLADAADKGDFSLWKYMTSYTMDSVCQTTLGIQLGIQKKPDHPFLKSFERFTELVAMRILLPWLHSDIVYKVTPYYNQIMKNIDYMTDFVSKIIVEKRQTIKAKEDKKHVKESNMETEKSQTRTFLELLIESSGGDKGYTDLELREETMVMLLAGTDTSAVGASFAAVMLSKHPDVQDKLYSEIQEVLGDSDRPITSEDLPRFKYLDAVVKETLRLYPPVPITARVTDKDVTLPSGVKVVANVGIIIHIWGTHRNPKYWGEDVETFRPERFFDTPLAHPAAYMPFSYGPRNCLGYQYATMSMKTVIANLIRRYQILPTEQSRNEGAKPLRVKFDIMMKHVDNFQLKLVSRK